jgi:hypothetical protein
MMFVPIVNVSEINSVVPVIAVDEIVDEEIEFALMLVK